MLHKNMTGEAAVHQSAYVQAADPGAVGALKAWIDTTGSPAVHKVRNADNTAWITVGGAGASPAAASVTYAGSTNLAATNVEGAIDELDAEKAPLSHTHSGADITSGTVDVARIGTGTKDATTFYRGDGTFAAPSGGGSAEFTKVALGSDVSTSSSALSDVTGLSFAVTSGTLYFFELDLVWTAGTDNDGIAVAFDGPAFTRFAYLGQLSGTVSGATINIYGASYDALHNYATGSKAAGSFGWVRGYVLPSASGTFAVRFAIDPSGTTAVAKAGSTLRYRS